MHKFRWIFSTAHWKPNPIDVENQFEYLYDQLFSLQPNSHDNTEWFKVKLVDITHQSRNLRAHLQAFISPEHWKSLRGIRSNKSIRILPPDKDSRVVLMNKVDYSKKMEEVLFDQSKFKRETNLKDNTSSMEKKITKELKLLLKEGIIANNTYRSNKPFGSHIPKFYG